MSKVDGSPSPPVSAWEPVEEGLRRVRLPSTLPEKSDAEREGAAREKLSRGGYWPHLPYLPKLWGMTEHARDLRARGAERISVKGKGVQTLFPSSDEGAYRGEAAPCTVLDKHGYPVGGTLTETWGATAFHMWWMADDDRGLPLALRLYRKVPIVGSVALATVATRASTGKVAVGRTRKVVSARKARDLASMSVKATVGVSDLDAARVKREARGVILCDARKAPPRSAGGMGQIFAF